MLVLRRKSLRFFWLLFLLLLQMEKRGKEVKKKSVRLAVDDDTPSRSKIPLALGVSTSAIGSSGSSSGLEVGRAGSDSSSLASNSGGGSSNYKPPKSPLLFLSRRMSKSGKKKREGGDGGGGGVGGPAANEASPAIDYQKLATGIRSSGSSPSIGAAESAGDSAGDSQGSQLSLGHGGKQTTLAANSLLKPRKGISKVLHDLRYRSIRHPKVSKSRSAPFDVSSVDAMDSGGPLRSPSMASDDDTYSSTYATPMQSEATSSGYSTPMFSSGVCSPNESLSESLIEDDADVSVDVIANVKDDEETISSQPAHGVDVNSQPVSFNPFSASLPANMSRLYCGVYIVGPTIRRVDVDPSNLPHLLDSQVVNDSSTITNTTNATTTITTPTNSTTTTASNRNTDTVVPPHPKVDGETATRAQQIAPSTAVQVHHTVDYQNVTIDASGPGPGPGPGLGFDAPLKSSSLISIELNKDHKIDSSVSGARVVESVDAHPLAPVNPSPPSLSAVTDTHRHRPPPPVPAAVPVSAADRAVSTGEIRFCFSEFKGLQTSTPNREPSHGFCQSLPARTDVMDPVYTQINPNSRYTYQYLSIYLSYCSTTKPKTTLCKHFPFILT